MSEERESRIDTCVECCVRDRDSSEKKVYRCELCDRWFCEKHFEPRLAFIRSYQAIDDSPEIRGLYYTEMQRQDGHPDFEYSRRKFVELDIEEQRRSELIKEAFDRMNAHYKGKPKPKSIPELKEENYQPTERDLQIYEKPRTRRPFPTKKVAGILLAVVVIGALLWYAPTIISFIQNSSYTKLTLTKNSSTFPNSTTLTFGNIDYSFSYVWQNNQYFLSVGDSILEGKSYPQPTNSSVYRDFGLEIKVSEADSNQIVLLVKPTVQDYLASLSFKKMTITQGQYQTVNFSGNEYTIGYLQNPPYYVNELIVTTSLLQSRQYSISSSQIVSCDLGLEIRVYKATTAYAIIYVKPSY